MLPFKKITYTIVVLIFANLFLASEKIRIIVIDMTSSFLNKQVDVAFYSTMLLCYSVSFGLFMLAMLWLIKNYEIMKYNARCIVPILSILIAFITSLIFIYLYSSYGAVLQDISFRGYHTLADFGDLIGAIPLYRDELVFDTNYPPLMIVIYRIMNVIYSSDRVTYGGQNWIVIIYFVSSIALLQLSIWIYLSNLEPSLRIAIALVTVISGPMLFTFSRANIIVYSLICTVLFLGLYESDNRYLQFIGMFCLALAANIKYYPSIFGLVLLCKKRYKDAVFTSAMGIVLFVTPTFADTVVFNGGGRLIDNIIQPFRKSLEFVEGGTWGLTMSLRDILYNALYPIILNDSIYTVVSIITAVIIALSVIIIVLNNDEEIRICLISLLCVLIPSVSYYYSMVYMLIPLLFLLNMNKELSKRYWLMIFLCVSAILPEYGWCSIFKPYTYWHIILLWSYVAYVGVKKIIRKVHMI